jgi:hypothetical protein
MMNCERCGELLPENALACPKCGVATSASQQRPQLPHYTPPQPGYMPPQQTYGYGPQPGYMPPQQTYGYGPQFNPAPNAPGVNVTVVNNAHKSNTPVLVEVLLSLFLGIYGVGWLMAGETTIGITLLICSFVIFWPIVILSIVLTLGLGLFCVIPLEIGAVILNAVLLNSTLNRKTTQITMVQTR